MIKMALLAYFHNKETCVQGIIDQKFGLKLINEANKEVALLYFGYMLTPEQKAIVACILCLFMRHSTCNLNTRSKNPKLTFNLN